MSKYVLDASAVLALLNQVPGGEDRVVTATMKNLVNSAPGHGQSASDL